MAELWMEGGGAPPFAVHGPAILVGLGRQDGLGRLAARLDPRRPHGHPAARPRTCRRGPRHAARRSSSCSCASSNSSELLARPASRAPARRPCGAPVRGRRSAAELGGAVPARRSISAWVNRGRLGVVAASRLPPRNEGLVIAAGSRVRHGRRVRAIPPHPVQPRARDRSSAGRGPRPRLGDRHAAPRLPPPSRISPAWSRSRLRSITGVHRLLDHRGASLDHRGASLGSTGR